MRHQRNAPARRVSPRGGQRVAVAGVLVALLLAAPAARADLRIHAEAGGAAPLDYILRRFGAGFSVGGAIDYEVVGLLSVGLFYTFTDFVGDDQADVYDHALGGRLALRYVRHRTAGWFGRDSGNLYGEAYLELELGYHYLGQEHRVGWGFGLGYRVLVAGPFGLGPMFRFQHVISDEVKPGTSETVHQLWVSFGLSLFLSFDLTGRGTQRDRREEPERSTADREAEWEEFEETPAETEPRTPEPEIEAGNEPPAEPLPEEPPPEPLE